MVGHLNRDFLSVCIISASCIFYVYKDNCYNLFACVLCVESLLGIRNEERDLLCFSFITSFSLHVF